MAALAAFSLPLTTLPFGYASSARSFSSTSARTAFDTGVDKRDQFFGRRACGVCGRTGTRLIHRVPIVPHSERDIWRELRGRLWIPVQAKRHIANEPRNGLLMCRDHCRQFEAYHFFIRYFPGPENDPKLGRYVLINYADFPDLRPFHNKAVALDAQDHHAPFPALFIIHEMRVRGWNPFSPTAPDAPDDIPPWQDWPVSRGALQPADGGPGLFVRGLPARQAAPPTPPPDSPLAGVPDANADEGGSSTVILPPAGDALVEIVAATHTMPAWQAREVENTSREGAAAEDIRIEVQEPAEAGRNLFV
ncbi:uncharacterized protein BXZ73DRAFT_101780 [Epithele typhae]|uniref:uncharacterized protein n=1 Tax=Epithele typhae TaxID=378194 RepID=UPI00200753FE|nr:uncharacterized protein BXZ73DRAFT_101780 [Epithele typhae]KAH9930404.1 hypothetical protein BXZ73DRAFT_101780 [Epithele typhae]